MENATAKESCPYCGGKVTESMQEQSFQWGVDIPDTLKAVVPVLSCHGCGLEWTDYRAEDQRAYVCFMHLKAKKRAERKARRKAMRAKMSWWEYFISFFNF